MEPHVGVKLLRGTHKARRKGLGAFEEFRAEGKRAASSPGWKCQVLRAQLCCLFATLEPERAMVHLNGKIEPPGLAGAGRTGPPAAGARGWKIIAKKRQLWS